MKKLETLGLLLIVAIIAGGILAGLWLTTNPDLPYAREKVCRQEAHDLGLRYLDYDHLYGECWAQRADGSIVNLFAGGRT